MTEDLAGKQAKNYLVKTVGFRQQYASKEKATAEFEKLKAKRIRNEESFLIVLQERASENSNWNTIEECKITPSFYE